MRFFGFHICIEASFGGVWQSEGHRVRANVLMVMVCNLVHRTQDTRGSEATVAVLRCTYYAMDVCTEVAVLYDSSSKWCKCT